MSSATPQKPHPYPEDAAGRSAAGEAGYAETGASLTIVIPALNEEAGIAAIIERCLAARAEIIARTDVGRVSLLVVSDGSTDRTAEIASGYPEVTLVVFPENRGYGAAIQAGWQACPGDLLAFLDADGTCDPLYFPALCNSVLRDGFDIALGSRLGAGSQMPKVRRVGNRIYAALLGILSRRQVRDTASGMRVLRREILFRLLPLPDGLHFTPAMSARALLDGLSIAEVPMSYQERVGRSKLHVLRDGVRFLQVILATALYVRPSRLALPLLSMLALTVAVLMLPPAAHYAAHRSVEEWMIYRFLLAGLLATVSASVLGATYVMEQLIAVSRGELEDHMRERVRWWTRITDRGIGYAGLTLFAAGVALAWPAVSTYVASGTVTAHWSRIVTAMFCELLAAQAGITVLTNLAVRGVARQQASWLAAIRGGKQS